MSVASPGRATIPAAYKALASATIGLTLGFSSVGFASFGVFIIPLSETFGWGRGDISLAFTIMSYAAAAAVPFLGVIVDRFGVRRVLLPAMVAFGLVIGSLSFLSGNITQLYFAYLLVAIVGVGTSAPVYSRAIVRWFDKSRGLALGIGLSGIGLGAAIVPPIVQAAINYYGWQGGYLALALLILAVTFPVCWLWLREPEDVADDDEAVKGKIAPVTGHTLSQAVRLRTFWQMLISFTLLGIFTAGVMAHLVPLMRDRGASVESAALAASLLGIALLIGRVFTGFLLDRFFAPLVVAICLAAAAVGVAILAAGMQGIAVYVAIALMGFGIGAEIDFMAYLVSRYHGLLAYTRIYGIFYSLFLIGSGLGPLLMGYGQQTTGSYDLALLVLCIITSAAIIPLALLGRYPTFATSMEGE